MSAWTQLPPDGVRAGAAAASAGRAWTPPRTRAASGPGGERSPWEQAVARACGSARRQEQQDLPRLWRVLALYLRRAQQGMVVLERQMMRVAWIVTQTLCKARLGAGSSTVRTRQLAIEERLTLGPKQHLYLVRCGEQRLLVASAGEAALQWIALPEAEAVTQAGPEAAQAVALPMVPRVVRKAAFRKRAQAQTAAARTGFAAKPGRAR